MKKKKIITISDHPLSPSGVGIQTKNVCEALLKTNRYKIVSLGGAIGHNNYNSVRVEPYGDDWIIHPVDGYGTPEHVRSILAHEKPDILWFMTDPRFYGWLWEMENEIRANVPMVYYHVWDNYPAPAFNGRFYRSTDKVVCISKLTKCILDAVSPEVDSLYLPHAVSDSHYRKYKKGDPQWEDLGKLRKRLTVEMATADHIKNENKKIFFWTNRNARRKQSGTIIWWFKEWLDKVGHDKAMLVMHTDARDPHGQDLPHLIGHVGADQGQVILSTNKISMEEMAKFYNVADFTINIADAEGFGLATLESLSCGTPIIVTMTGGLQEQVTDGENWFGFGIEPTSQAVIGSLQVPYIYEDRLSQQDFNKTLSKALRLSKKAYNKMSIQGRQHVNKNYNFENFEKEWVNVIDETIEKYGSWDTRKHYTPWTLQEIK